MDFSKGINLGTFHILDGAKIEARYPGQRRTCGRCHQTSNTCPGGGIAKACNENGGTKVKLSEFMVEHWKSIGFAPTEFTLDEDIDTENDVEIKDSEKFTPKKIELSEEEIGRLTGIILKNLPIALPDKDILEVLNEAGAPSSSSIEIRRPEGAQKVSVEINNLASHDCTTIIGNLNGKIIHGNKVFCRGSSDLHTSEKNQKVGNVVSNSKDPSIIKPIMNKEETCTDSITTEKPEGQTPAKPPVQHIPGLPAGAQSLTKSQIKKLKKNSKLKSTKNLQLEVLDPATQKALEHYNLSDYVFEDSDDNDDSNKDKTNKIRVNDIVDKLEKREDKKRGRSSPDNDERKIRQKSVVL